MTSAPDELRFDELWTDFLEGELPPEGIAELERLFEDRPSLQVRGADLLQTHRLLGFLLQDDKQSGDAFVGSVMKAIPQSDAAFTESVLQSLPGHSLQSPVPLASADANPTMPGFRSYAIATMLLVSLGCFLTMAWLHSGSRTGLMVEVVQVANGASAEWVPGEQILLDELALVRGNVQLRLPSDVVLDLHAPVELRFINAMNVHVRSGKITADVGERGKGFVIETTQARVVDLGTRFGVDASNAAHTDVVVFKGQVELFEPGIKERVALLNQGEGVRIEKHRRTSRIVSITSSGVPGSWSVQETGDQRAVITAVRDSMSASDEEAKKWPSLRNFYRIAPGGLHDGALAFADESDHWTSVPTSLRGADLVQTFAADGFNWWMQLTLSIQQPCELFVMVDRRNDVPSWLKEDFADTGETIVLNCVPRNQRRQINRQLEYGVWKRIITQPGEVTLGPPYGEPPSDRKSFQPNRMYGVAARPLP